MFLCEKALSMTIAHINIKYVTNLYSKAWQGWDLLQKWKAEFKSKTNTSSVLEDEKLEVPSIPPVAVQEILVPVEVVFFYMLVFFLS